MIKTNGFYIATKQYLVVDTPVFDEIFEVIQVMQFFQQNNKLEGVVMIAEYGEMKSHPIEISIKRIQDILHSFLNQPSEEEQDKSFYRIYDSKSHPKWIDVLGSEIFSDKKDPDKYPKIYPGKYVISDTNKITLHPEKVDGGIEWNYADGKITNTELSLTFHYEDKETVSIFKFAVF